ncbi:MAG: glutamate--tRNA ligase, partial [Candidatus Aureabacteria bacterium]|nr:glutamate--tRNA ligase [Candidatus Auribacterota bacterium]
LNPSFLPSFAHLPLIHSEDGTKLSKRHGATSVLEFKKMGYLPQALLNTLFLLGWSPGGDREIIDFYEACRLFSIEHVNKNAAQFSYEKTAWLNGQYIKKTPAKDLVAACLELDMEKIRDYRSKDSEKLMKAIEMTKSRPRLLPDLVKCISFFFEPHIDISHPLQEKYLSDKAAVMEKMAEVKDELRNISVFHAGPLEESLRKSCRDKGIQTKELLMPLRVILTGQDVTPGIFEVMELMGKELCLKRLIDFLNQNPE